MALAALSACGGPAVSPEQQKAIETRRSKEQERQLFKDMKKFVQEEPTVVCISGVQYLAWIDRTRFGNVHHLVPLFNSTNPSYALGCTGGTQRSIEDVSEKPNGDQPDQTPIKENL
jgi:hypothetical protein